MRTIVLFLVAFMSMSSTVFANGRQKLTQQEAQSFILNLFSEGDHVSSEGCLMRVQYEKNQLIFEVQLPNELPFVLLFNEEYSDIPFYLANVGSTSILTQDFFDSSAALKINYLQNGIQLEMSEYIAGETRKISCGSLSTPSSLGALSIGFP